MFFCKVKGLSQGSWECRVEGGKGPPGVSRSLLCLQVVGNLLYYRFLNPAVVAPDAFDIVAMAAGGALAAPQRHVLGAVAQLLQHAAAGKAFSGENQHLRILNDYLEETHYKFRSGAWHPILLSLIPCSPTFHIPHLPWNS